METPEDRDPVGRPAAVERTDGVTFVQVWQHRSSDHQQHYLETVRDSIGLLSGERGFRSFRLFAGTDGRSSAVVAEWADETSARAATSRDAAVRAHDRMTAWGEPSGSFYRLHDRWRATDDGSAAATVDGVEHRRVTVNGTELHYVSAGSAGSPVLLVHGFPETWWAFRKLIPLLADTHRVIAVDLPGFGDSSLGEAAHDSATTAAILTRLVAQLGLGPVHLLGQDLSGPTSYRVAATTSDLVRSYTFIESGLPGFGLEPLMDVAHGGSWHFGFFAAPEVPEMLLAGHEREFLTTYAYEGYTQVKDAIGPADVDEFLRTYAAPNGFVGALGLYRSMLVEGPELRQLGRQPLPMPVLTVGARGHGGYGDFSYQTMAQIAADVRGVVVEGSGHFVAQERPDELAGHLLDFFSRADELSSRPASLPEGTR